MARADLIRHPFYKYQCIVHILIAIIMALFSYQNLELIYQQWPAFLIFTIFLAVGNFFHKRFQDPFISLINESFSFAAMIAYSATYATAALIIPWLLPVIILDSRSRLEEYSHLAMLIIKLHIAYYVFNGFIGLFDLDPELSIVFALAGILAGLSMLIVESLLSFIIALSKKESLKLYKEEIIDRAQKSPLLWSWGLVFAHLIKMESYLFSILMIIPIIILYLYILQRRQLQNTIEKALDSITYMVGLRDSYTYQHSKNVEEYSHSLALAMGLSEKEADNIAQIAVLHDIGKVGIRDDVLLKSAGLDDDEWEEMTRHPDLGANLIRLIDILNIDSDGIRFHHERWDGRGYPNGLKGKEIPLSSRIITICDAWNAMRSDRPYRKALAYDEALKRIREGSGNQFDPEIVREAIKIFKREEPIRKSAKPKNFHGIPKGKK